MATVSTTDTTTEPESISALREVIRLCGTQQILADRLSEITGITVKQSRISMWITRGVVPPEWVIPCEMAVSGKVSRHDIRSDLYPRNHAA